ncbi:hypothetical protein HY483_00855 [Candidatus Woesearchaeota archaeon]|nr:hypothetical protein [Candidatus Woesearchaeota archaeon]
MMGCHNCSRTGGIMLLIAGLLFLSRDLGLWDFWNVQWWSLLLILAGVAHLGMSHCKQCQEMCGMKHSRKK